VVLDPPTVVAVLFIGMFTPADWQRLGPAAIATHVAQVATDPQTRVPELITLLLAARIHGLTGTAAQQLAAAVLAAAAGTR
jgi:hypothetical protein